ncbi:MAG: PKD domain-containing protein, partial [Proteobacteria bacterium]|nr:PKD domain-containing protein [Pseudomonadota bacterium]MBU1709419.1 PKD domain-containing protein [Pseudomonadota bacterium]
SGPQTFTITAYDITNNESAHSEPITANKAPQAEIQADGVNNLVAFDASQSKDFDDGTIVEYSWVFGDGSDASSDERIIHEYQPGNYTVTLTVTDNQRTINTTQVNITII